ncbi:hypothetical protein NW801_11775 [Brevibacillus laterosporus]|uniref:Uncharacterized protein n=1 Tax=Brevibacillus halotolerans TaxID=1507437 RepID=A0ABT4HXC5_9BACL|nr:MULTISPECIES: hypothetical protein [Brevibacillus]MCR8985716.1 hypothetical protein [Brevibacillus laterosporus]MCZ0831450.1 hypothetical protein [Brevibacillus halotolerans]
MEYQGEASKLTGKIQLVSEDLSNPTYFTPELANESFLKRIANTEAACLTNTEQIEQALETIQDNGQLNKDALRTIRINMVDIALELEMWTQATLNGVTANLFIETFETIDDVTLQKGKYDKDNRKLYLA